MLAKIADSSDELFDRHIAINLKGTFNGMREAGKRLRDGGRIVNVSTGVVGTRLETYGVATSRKAAVETMTAVLSKEMQPDDLVGTVARAIARICSSAASRKADQQL